MIFGFEISNLILYSITILGVGVLSRCMLEFKYSKIVQYTVGAFVAILCMVITLFVDRYSSNSKSYYLFITFTCLAIITAALFVLSKDTVFQTVFVIITQLDAMCIICYLSYIIATPFNGSIWVECIVRIAAFATIFLMYKFGLHKRYRLCADNCKEKWALLCLIPFAFFILFFFTLLYPSLIYDRSKYMNYIMGAEIFAITAMYWGLFYTFGGLVKNAVLQAENEKTNSKLKYWQQQIVLEQNMVEQAKQTRHDLRHQYTVLLGCMADKNYEKAKDYLIEQGAKLEDSKVETYCKNYTVNCLLTSYITNAKSKGINVTCNTNIPSGIIIDEMELAIILANLIENATEACDVIYNKDRKKYIDIMVKYQNSLLKICIVNSCNPGVKFNGAFPESTKEMKSGIGTKSVAKIAEKYNGMVEFAEEDGIFTARIVMNIN